MPDYEKVAAAALDANQDLKGIAYALLAVAAALNTADDSDIQETVTYDDTDYIIHDSAVDIPQNAVTSTQVNNGKVTETEIPKAGTSNGWKLAQTRNEDGTWQNVTDTKQSKGATTGPPYWYDKDDTLTERDERDKVKLLIQAAKTGSHLDIPDLLRSRRRPDGYEIYVEGQTRPLYAIAVGTSKGVITCRRTPEGIHHEELVEALKEAFPQATVTTYGWKNSWLDEGPTDIEVDNAPF